MSDSISIDFGSLLPYAEDRLLKLFGRDDASLAAARALEKQLRIAAVDASTVQIIGMDRPVSIFDIYQPTRLFTRKKRGPHTVHFDALLRESQNAVIVGGPGAGKTTLMQYAFAQLSQTSEHLPILVTLRRSDSLRFLTSLVDNIAAKRLRRIKGVRLIPTVLR